MNSAKNTLDSRILSSTTDDGKVNIQSDSNTQGKKIVSIHTRGSSRFSKGLDGQLDLVAKQISEFGSQKSLKNVVETD